MMFGGMFLFWILLIVGVGWFIKYMNDQKNFQTVVSQNSKNALTILRERYARGEINNQEFEERKSVLIG